MNRHDAHRALPLIERTHSYSRPFPRSDYRAGAIASRIIPLFPDFYLIAQTRIIRKLREMSPYSTVTDISTGCKVGERRWRTGCRAAADGI